VTLSRVRHITLPILAALALPACDDHPALKPDASSPTATATSSATAAPPPASHDAGTVALPKKPRGPCAHEAVMTFDDPVIETVVRRQLQLPNGPVKRDAMKGIKTFNIAQAKIDDLDPCLFAELTGVKGLYLPPGPYSDLTPLKPLVHLESLGLTSTAVKDLGVVATFAHMDRLDLTHTQISDVAPLGALTALTELQLDDTTVVDLSPLSKLVNLEVLSIQNTPVASVAPLHGLTHLKKLYVAGSLVTDLSPVQSIHGLRIFQQGR